MKQKKLIKEYIEQTWQRIVEIVPLVKYYEIQWLEKESNGDEGEFSIDFQPLVFDAVLYVFKNVFKRVPPEGLTDKFKNWIKMALTHEAGHLYLWEFEGTKRDREKIATLIGRLIFDILELEEEKNES